MFYMLGKDISADYAPPIDIRRDARPRASADTPGGVPLHYDLSASSDTFILHFAFLSGICPIN